MNKRYYIILIFLIVIISGCVANQNTKENAETIAQKFSIELQNSNYDGLYDLFTPELKSKRTKENFLRYVLQKGFLIDPYSTNYLIYDKLVMQGDNEAYAYYTFTSGLIESKIPPVHLIFTSEGWRIDSYASAFMDGCMNDMECTTSQKSKCDQNFECVASIKNLEVDTIENIKNENVTTVKNGDTIKVDYVGTLEDGTVFDTSIEKIAKESDSYQEGRPYQPLEFKVGAGQMISGFDAAVVGMVVNEEKFVILSPSEAYGESYAGSIKEVPIENLQNAGIKPKVGMTISANGMPAKIIKVGYNTVTVDFNHELAGKTLQFQIIIIEIV